MNYKNKLRRLHECLGSWKAVADYVSLNKTNHHLNAETLASYATSSAADGGTRIGENTKQRIDEAFGRLRQEHVTGLEAVLLAYEVIQRIENGCTTLEEAQQVATRAKPLIIKYTDRCITPTKGG
jgi:hypothetical protein